MKSGKESWVRQGSFCLNQVTAAKFSERPSTKLDKMSGRAMPFCCCLHTYAIPMSA